jgi:hypothetical protein
MQYHIALSILSTLGLLTSPWRPTSAIAHSTHSAHATLTSGLTPALQPTPVVAVTAVP